MCNSSARQHTKPCACPPSSSQSLTGWHGNQHRMMAAFLPLKHAARAARPARGPLMLLACVCAAVLLCAALHPPALAGRGLADLRSLPAAEHAAAGTRRAPFVIAIATVHRPGGSQYLPATLQSLSCALGTPPPAPPAHEPDATAANNSAASVEDEPPLVLVVNTEVPASRNTAFAALEAAAGGGTSAGLQLTTLALGELHPELHSPAFVATLTARMRQDTLLRTLVGGQLARRRRQRGVHLC